MYLQRVEEITPNISYCAYNLKEGTTDINDLMQLRLSATAAGGTHDPVLTAKIDVSPSIFFFNRSKRKNHVQCCVVIKLDRCI